MKFMKLKEPHFSCIFIALFLALAFIVIPPTFIPGDLYSKSGDNGFPLGQADENHIFSAPVSSFNASYVDWKEHGSSPFLSHNDSENTLSAYGKGIWNEGYFGFNVSTNFDIITAARLHIYAKISDPDSNDYVEVYDQNGYDLGGIAPNSRAYVDYALDLPVTTGIALNSFRFMLQCRSIDNRVLTEISYVYIDYSGEKYPLHTSYQDIYGSNGNQVKLYIVNIFYGGGQHITSSDIQNIRNMGFNAIRLHIYWNKLQPVGPYNVNATVFTYTGNPVNFDYPSGIGLDAIVSWSAQNGMAILLTPAWTNSYPVPSWAVSSSGMGETTGDSYEGNNTHLNTISNLLGEGAESATVRSGVNYLYNWMAQHYFKNDNVIFESFNELVTLQDGTAPIQSFANFNNGWIQAIEQAEGAAKNHLKIVEYLRNDDWEYQYAAPYVTGTHSNVLLASHNYAPKDYWDPSGPHGIAYVQTQILTMANAARNIDYPWINTEFSKSIDQAQWQSWYFTVLKSFQDSNVAGWASFCYSSDPNAQTENGQKWNLNNATIRSQMLPVLQRYIA